jgi:tellurite resistance protein
MVTLALRWLVLEHPAGARVYGWILLAAVTGLVGAIAARTVVAGLRRQLLPSAPAAQPEETPSGELADVSRRAGLAA